MLDVTSKISSGNKVLDSRFRGNDEIEQVICHSREKRESRKMAQQKSYPDLLRRYE